MLSLLSSIAITNTIYLLLGKLFTKSNPSNIKKFSEIAINGFIYFSFLALFLNFFVPLDIKINTLIFFSILIFFLFKKNNLKKRELLILIIIIFFCFLLILFDTVYRPDAGLYHLPFIKILNEEKIIFGLSNLHFRFGMVSIIQYTSAINNNIFTKDVGILIPLLSIYCFLTFYFLGDILEFLFKKSRQNYNYLSVFFSSLVVLYISYKINRYSEFGNDAIAHLFFLFLISKIINFNKIDYQNFNQIYLISIFAVLNKFTLIFSLIIPAYIFFKEKFSFKKTILSLPTLFLCLWIIRNIVTSGCAFYPQTFTCFTELKWSNKQETIFQNTSAEAWAKDWPNRNDTKIKMKDYIKNFNWLETWKNNHFKKIIKILIPYLIILFLIYLYFRFRIKKKFHFNLNSYIYNLILFTSLFGTLIFFLKFPIYRYGYSYLISLIILSLIFLLKFYDLEKIKKLSISVILIFFISFVYKQTDRYVKYYTERNFIPEIYNKDNRYKIIKKDNESFYNVSLNGSCMYNVNLCTSLLTDKFIIKKRLSYKFFETDQKNQ